MLETIIALMEVVLKKPGMVFAVATSTVAEEIRTHTVGSDPPQNGGGRPKSAMDWGDLISHGERVLTYIC